VELGGAAGDVALSRDLLVREVLEEVFENLLFARREGRCASDRAPGRMGRPRLVDETRKQGPWNPEAAGAHLVEDARQPLRSLNVRDKPFGAEAKKRECGGLRELLGHDDRAGRGIRSENLRDERFRARAERVPLDHVQDGLRRKEAFEGVGS